MPYKDRSVKREYQRTWVAARRADYMDGRKCASCGSAENLENDHIDPSQKITHKVFSLSLAKRSTELLKCQALCVDCHRTKTAKDRLEKTPLTHGASGYRRGCRCAKCKVGHREKMQDWHSRTR